MIKKTELQDTLEAAAPFLVKALVEMKAELDTESKRHRWSAELYEMALQALAYHGHQDEIDRIVAYSARMGQ